jgi:hypothetical protein
VYPRKVSLSRRGKRGRKTPMKRRRTTHAPKKRKMTSRLPVSLRRLRDLSVRIAEVARKYERSTGPVSTHAKAVLAANDAFHVAYDLSRAARGEASSDTAALRRTIDRLRLVIRQWLTITEPAFPLETRDLGRHLNRAEDAVAAATKLAALVADRGAHLPYAKDLVHSLHAELGKVGPDVTRRQIAASSVRSHALELHRQLVVFRRLLNLTVGPDHIDYLRLRSNYDESTLAPIDVPVAAGGGEARRPHLRLVSERTRGPGNGE